MPTGGELSYPPYGPREDQGGGEPASLNFDWSGLGNLATGANVSAAGAGAEAFANLAQGILAAKRAKKFAAYNADVAEANAESQANAAEIEAQQYIRRAALARRQQQEEEQIAGQAQAYREARQEEQNERILGQTRAIIASSGVMLSGSPMAVLEETARQQRLDILATRYQTSLQLRQSRIASEESATQDEYAAQLARFGAGERLRIGRAQGAALRSGADGSAVGAGLLKATASLTKGAAEYAYNMERQKSRTLLQ